MKCRGRLVASPTKNGSYMLLWLGAMIAPPSSGTYSAPVTLSRNTSLAIGVRMARTTA